MVHDLPTGPETNKNNNKYKHARCDILKVMKMSSVIFWVMTIHSTEMLVTTYETT
jgi:hypothetical protein